MILMQFFLQNKVNLIHGKERKGGDWMEEKLNLNGEEELLRRVEMLEVKQKRVTAQLDAVTHKLAELDQGQIEILARMIKSQEASMEFDKELFRLLQGIVNTDFIKKLS